MEQGIIQSVKSDSLTISVCIATYNGEKYIRNQIDSIISQLTADDEIVISDDGSSDKTVDIIEKIKTENNNMTILLVRGPQMGFSSNFGNAIKHSSKDIIVFSDQDDIWHPEKIKIIRDAFQRDRSISTLLHSMATFHDNKLDDTNELVITYHKGVIRNFIKSSYWGCCMAVKRDFADSFMPLREYCVGHDQLFGLLSERFGKTIFISKKLIWHRLHNKNTSNPRTIKEMIVFRWNLAKDYLYALRMRNSR